MTVQGIEERRFALLKFFLPALFSGGLAYAAFLLLGDTPLIRASGLALVIVGVTLALRRMGSVLAVIGGLTLAFSPAFWSQTGGGQGDPATIVIALGAAVLAVLLASVASRQPYIGLGIGLLVFAVLFWSQIGTPRSIRLTGFVTGWIVFLLIDMLLLTNPRPDEAPLILREGRKNPDGSLPARPYHTWGILLLFAIGVLNDPLLTLLAPALGLSLYLTRTKFPFWYWILFGLVVGIGLRGLGVDYLQAQSHLLVLEQWRHAQRWIDMGRLVIEQFGVVGIVLGVLGLARLSRWYPPLGTVTLLAYGAYAFFGLVYTGSARPVLLLPLFTIQVVWMTYAVLALSEWASKSTGKRFIGQYAVIALYACLPAFLLWQIIRAG